MKKIQYRPDLYGKRAVEYDRLIFRIANHFLERMYNQRKFELARCYVLYRERSKFYNLPLLEHHIKMGETDRPNANKYLNWKDASLSVAYFEYVLNRLSRYGLHWGALKNNKFPDYKEKIRSDEDELVDYFLYEMRKPPVKKEEIPSMPQFNKIQFIVITNFNFDLSITNIK